MVHFWSTLVLSTQASRVECVLNVRSIMAAHLWLRAEKKPNERRTHLTPERCKEIINAGEYAWDFLLSIFFFREQLAVVGSGIHWYT